MVTSGIEQARFTAHVSGNDREDERLCKTEIVARLLEAKGAEGTTSAVHVAIDSSLIQLATADFELVFLRLCALIIQGGLSKAYQLSSLRLLSQVLETARSVPDDIPRPCTVNANAAQTLVGHLVRQVVELSRDDNRQSAISDVLIELSPMHPAIVMGGLLAALDQTGGEQVPACAQLQLVRILTEIAYSVPYAFNGRLHEVMSRHLPMLQASKTPEVKTLLYKAWCSLCVAFVKNASLVPEEPGPNCEANLSHAFGEVALEIRRKGALVTSADVSVCGHALDRQRSQQALSTAFAILLSSWQSSKDLGVRIGAMEALGHLCLVIPKDLFLSNADALLELLLNLLARQTTSALGMPSVNLLRGLCLMLQACIDADVEMLLLENTLHSLVSTMFTWIVSSGPIQHLQGGVGMESLQSQAELLRCFEVVCTQYQKHLLSFLLQKSRGSRDDKLATLLVLRHLFSAVPSGQLPTGVVEGVQHLTLDSDPFVGMMLGELIVAFSRAGTLAAVEGSRSEGDDHPRCEHVHNLMQFLIKQTALKQLSEVHQSYVVKLVTKTQPKGLLSCEEVRGSAGIVLAHLVSSLTPTLRNKLWPMVLQALLNPEMRRGFPAICRAAAAIVTKSLQDAHSDRVGNVLAELAASGFQVGSRAGDRTQSSRPRSESLLAWFLICAHSPHEPAGAGAAVLHCLEVMSPLLHPVLGNIWEAPSARLQTLRLYLDEEGSSSRLDAETWASALSQEVHFFLSALPEHDDLPAKLVDVLGCFHLDLCRKDRDHAVGTAATDRVALLNLTGTCLSHVAHKEKVNNSLEFLVANTAEYITDNAVRSAYARALGMTAQRHFDIVLSVLDRVAKTDVATRRAGSIAQSFFGKSTAVHQAECMRSMLALSFGYCAVYAPSREALHVKICDSILAPLATSLLQERTVVVLGSVIEGVRTASDAVRASPQSIALRDPFLLSRTICADEKQICSQVGWGQDLKNALSLQRDALVQALLPLIEPPTQGEEEQKLILFEELGCRAMGALCSLIAMPLELQSNLYASVLDESLNVLLFSLSDCQAQGSDNVSGIDPTMRARIDAVTDLIRSLLFHAHSWLGVSRLLQAVHAAGANGPVEFVRRTCTRLLCELCRAAPILAVTAETAEATCDADGGSEYLHGDVGDWCECLALLLPRTGDSCKDVVATAIDALVELLSRCEWTASSGVAQDIRRGDPAPPSQQMVGVLVARLPPSAIPPLVQHLMSSMHDADSHAALTGVDALFLILQACGEKLSKDRATNLVATIFEEVEKVSHSSVRQKVLACVKVLALYHFDTVVRELLDIGPDFSMSAMGALHAITKEKTLLPRLLNYLTDTLNNSDPGNQKRPNCLVLSATVALGHLFTASDSSVGIVVKKYFPQLFGTFLLRIGTTTEGLMAQQTAAAFMNFLHASQNDSMAIALEGNRLSSVTQDFYDEVICELTVLFCRHHPSKRELLLSFLVPFLSRPFPGHRVATVTTLSQVLLSSSDNVLCDDAISASVQNILRYLGDPNSTVRKQCARGIGNYLSLKASGGAQPNPFDPEFELQQMLPAVLRVLSDEVALVQIEAVFAVQRACKVDRCQNWEKTLMSCSRQLAPLIDADEPKMRKAALDLVGYLCAISLEFRTKRPSPQVRGIPLLDNHDLGADSPQQVPHTVEEEMAAECIENSGETGVEIKKDCLGCFGQDLNFLLIHCVVHLEDADLSVQAAAASCLQQLVTDSSSLLFGDDGTQIAVEAAELLQRRLQERMEFKQFVFPFIAIACRSSGASVARERLSVCRAYLTTLPPRVGDFPTLRHGASTAVAAGYVAVALARCWKNTEARPSDLLCGICRDLLGLLGAEDPTFTSHIAKLFGFFDILAAPDFS